MSNRVTLQTCSQEHNFTGNAIIIFNMEAWSITVITNHHWVEHFPDKCTVGCLSRAFAAFSQDDNRFHFLISIVHKMFYFFFYNLIGMGTPKANEIQFWRLTWDFGFIVFALCSEFHPLSIKLRYLIHGIFGIFFPAWTITVLVMKVASISQKPWRILIAWKKSSGFLSWNLSAKKGGWQLCIRHRSGYISMSS